MGKVLGMNMKAARKSKGMTQKELAKRIGKTESSIRKYEAGITEAPLPVLYDIAGALDMTFSEMVNMIPSPDVELSRRETDLIDMYRLLSNDKKIRLVDHAIDLMSLQEYEDKFGDIDTGEPIDQDANQDKE